MRLCALPGTPPLPLRGDVGSEGIVLSSFILCLTICRFVATKLVLSRYSRVFVVLRKTTSIICRAMCCDKLVVVLFSFIICAMTDETEHSRIHFFSFISTHYDTQNCDASYLQSLFDVRMQQTSCRVGDRPHAYRCYQYCDRNEHQPVVLALGQAWMQRFVNGKVVHRERLSDVMKQFVRKLFNL